MTVNEQDRINRAEEIQRYTENRCEYLEKENTKLKKAFYLFVDWMTECDIGYDNLEDSYIKYRNEIDEKKLNYIQGLIYTALKESENDDSNHLENKIKEFDVLLEGGCK